MRKTLMKGGGAVAAIVAAMMISGLIPPGNANAGEPANKASVAGDDVKVISPGSPQPILTEVVKTSSPTDLMLQVTLECSIITDVASKAQASNETATGQVEIWVSIDKSAPIYADHVPVAQADTTKGRVTFCSRTHQQIVNFDDPTERLETYLRTKDANAFNWMALNVGSATHTIRVHAALTGTPECAEDEPLAATGTTCAKALIGNRTLLVEPTKAANRETITIN